ncbi:MAG: class I SAM-dependent methyltransferase [Kiritimatiellia bacterium]
MPAMYEIYRRHRVEYDRLVAAEDHARHLPAGLHSLVDWRGKTVLEGGLGTGRVTELFIAQARRWVGCDREPHMLAAARERLAPFADKLDLRVADNLALPVVSEKAEIFVEGWSWGHAVVDGPGDVEPIAEALFANVRKNLVPGGFVVLIETLGTNALSPGAPHPRLAEFYQLLQSRYGLQQAAISTDYRFPSVREAAETLGFFFGDALKQAVLAAGSPTVPEWTGLWSGPVPP